MKKTFLILVSIVSSMMAQSAFSHVLETGKVTRIYPAGTYVVTFKLDGADNTTLCPLGAQWTLETTDGLFKEKYSLILTAMSLGKTVTFMHHDQLGCGNGNTNKIYSVDFAP